MRLSEDVCNVLLRCVLLLQCWSIGGDRQKIDSGPGGPVDDSAIKTFISLLAIPAEN